MDVYATDEEKVEAIKKWWKQNGKSVIAGVVIGLLAVFGWRTWTEYRNNQAQLASAAYMQVLTEAAQQKSDAAIQQGEQLISKYSSSPYAVLAALEVAKLKVDKGNLVAAESHLKWAADHASLPGVKALVRLRLARVAAAQGKNDEALAVLNQGDPGSFAAQYDEVRGDIYARENKPDKARSAYSKALQSLDAKSPSRSLIQMKLDSLPAAAS